MTEEDTKALLAELEELRAFKAQWGKIIETFIALDEAGALCSITIPDPGPNENRFGKYGRLLDPEEDP